MPITYAISPQVTNEALNALFATAWENHTSTDFTLVLSRSLLYVCAYDEGQLAGFVNVAWDGGVHAFLLDTAVAQRVARSGVGTALVRVAVEHSRTTGCEWLHVDFDDHLRAFYFDASGFEPTNAGLIALT